MSVVGRDRLDAVRCEPVGSRGRRPSHRRRRARAGSRRSRAARRRRGRGPCAAPVMIGDASHQRPAPAGTRLAGRSCARRARRPRRSARQAPPGARPSGRSSGPERGRSAAPACRDAVKMSPSGSSIRSCCSSMSMITSTGRCRPGAADRAARTARRSTAEPARRPGGCSPRHGAGSPARAGSARLRGTAVRPGSRSPRRSCRPRGESRRRTRRRSPSKRRMPGRRDDAAMVDPVEHQAVHHRALVVEALRHGLRQPVVLGLADRHPDQQAQHGIEQAGRQLHDGQRAARLPEERLRLEQVAMPHAQHDVAAGLGELRGDVAARSCRIRRPGRGGPRCRPGSGTRRSAASSR